MNQSQPKYPEGTPEYAAYREALRKALKEPNAWDFLDDIPIKNAARVAGIGR